MTFERHSKYMQLKSLRVRVGGAASRKPHSSSDCEEGLPEITEDSANFYSSRLIAEIDKILEESDEVIEQPAQ